MKSRVRVPFVGSSYELMRKVADVQRSVNLCPTPVESGAARLFLEAIPGLRIFGAAPAVPPEPVPNIINLFTLDWAFEGQPFCDVSASG